MTERTRGANGQFQRKAGSTASAEAEDGSGNGEAPRPKNCRVFVRAKVAKALPDIVAKLIAEAKNGSIPHMALLLKTAGLDTKEDNVPKRRRGKGLARILKEQWEADAVKFAERERQQQRPEILGE